MYRRRGCSASSRRRSTWPIPTIFIGLLIGGSVAFLFSSLAIRAVGRSAGTVVQEVRRQFREHPGIMDYTEKPEYGRVISICTAAAQRELVTPALLAVLTPVIVGFGLNYLALGAFLAAAILTGQLMANFLSNSGGAWDNAKKYIEDGHEGGKGSEAHTAAVIGDTVGDPFKDTAGPALNPLIKVMNLVSLLILPAVITLRHHTGARLGIAAAGIVILGGAIAFSKRKSGGFGGEEEVAEIKAPDQPPPLRRWRPDATARRSRAGRGHPDESAGHGHRRAYRAPGAVDTGVLNPPRSSTTMPSSTRSPSTGPASAGKPLVIVESPAKARTIAALLGGGFVVESSVGHIRDLPRRADEIPSAYKGEGWARLGVDVDNGFKPLYVVAPEKKSVVARLKSLLAGASEVYLATDEDREGESIAWHLTEVLSPRVPIKRMVFHEITAPALQRAVEEWRDLDRRLVDAQEARRILDRLYGYEVSPVLWKKVMPRLSAGRVQSVATRMIVERERARMRFRAGTWWDLEGTFDASGQSFAANLVAVGGTPVATGRDFTETGSAGPRPTSCSWPRPTPRAWCRGSSGQPFTVRAVTEKPYRRSPAPPFMTSTLQQEASRKLRFGAQRTMQVAQRLYEQGWITYMRTDSTTLSDEALTAARAQASALYGREFVPDAPRRYERKVKNAQEAHEAIRPAGEAFRTPDEAGR